ncbi:response regulator [Cohnella zeiphila]|uniref:Response regulator n=1 Tax=Cohnella zeiphila TaxID=2761120 RepID=A0A7X0SND1_9BACL|nr:response regulator [Cohnella zeiphila]MBB6730923.1 response regulator [Cohnella zeiphila]
MYKVLLVDDEPFAIEGLELLIDWEKRGFRVEGACGNGEEAIRRIRLDPPDLVVTDIRMPVLDGFELIEGTRRMGNDSTLFVIASGYDDFEYARRAMRLGVTHYLTKPVVSEEADELLGRLENELRERERRLLIRHSADRYAASHALSVLLFGGEDSERREALRTLSPLAEQAFAWAYLHVGTDEEGLGAVREAALGMAEELECCHLIDCDRGAFGLVLGLKRSDREEIQIFANRLLPALQEATPGRIGVAAGRVVERLDDLSVSYRSAAEAERFLFFGTGQVIHYEDIRGKTLSSDPGALKAADAIVEAVENGRPDELEAAVREAFRTFEARMTLPELVGIFCTQVVLRCASVYKELGGDPNELIKEAGLDDGVPPGRHLRESAESLTRFCLKCQSAAFRLRDRRTGGTPAKVADFLRRNYTASFTIKEIAERFYINPVYLGQSFSRKYGMGILDYIHDLRIEEAKRRLRETDDASYTIAESVGYRGYQHFLKQFEKRLGMKPADYRLLSSP